MCCSTEHQSRARLKRSSCYLRNVCLQIATKCNDRSQLRPMVEIGIVVSPNPESGSKTLRITRKSKEYAGLIGSLVWTSSGVRKLRGRPICPKYVIEMGVMSLEKSPCQCSSKKRYSTIESHKYLTRFSRQAKKARRSYKSESIGTSESEQRQTNFLGETKYFEVAACYNWSKANVRMNDCSWPVA